CVCFRTWVDRGKLDVLRDDGPIVFALGDGVWQTDRAPTSRAGALYELRRLVAEHREGTAHPRVRAALAGRLDAILVCQTGHDVAAAQSALGNLMRRFAVRHTPDAIDVAGNLSTLRRPVVVGPYSFATSRRVLLGAAVLSEAGVEVAFRGGFPEAAPDALRVTAALAVRHGMDPDAARRAMTIVPATAAGIAGRVGAITPGKEADLVVFSGDPLRLDAVVSEVYVRGIRVYAAENQLDPSAGGAP
ncbi:MAG: amidohydrolase family protein, partial [Planctomycetota bacterium]